MPRHSGTEFMTPALLRFDDERQLEFPEHKQSRIIGRKVERLDVIALCVLDSCIRTASFCDHVVYLSVQREESLRPRRIHCRNDVTSHRTIPCRLAGEITHHC